MIDSYLLLITGCVVVCIISFDFFYTTLSFNGAGYINRVVAASISSFFLFCSKHTNNRNIFKLSGLAQILISIMIWIGLLWLGFFLILLSSHSSVIQAATNTPADVVNKIYFSGYIISTLGNGEFIPSSELWQIITVIFSFSGFIFITTGISYVLNLNSAVLHKRSLGLYIANLGKTPQEIIINTYTNGSFDRLVAYIPSLQAKINRHNQNHYAYPISHYYYSTSRDEALVVNMANLSEALTLIKYHIDNKSTVEQDLHPLHNSMQEFLNTVQQSFSTKTEGYNTVSLDEDRLNDLGIPLIDASLSESEQEAIDKRRSTFSNLLKSSGWTWDDLYQKNDG